MKIYISGKIAGDPDYKGKFARAAAQLERLGATVINPATAPEGLDKLDYMRICFAEMEAVDYVGLRRVPSGLVVFGWREAGTRVVRLCRRADGELGRFSGRHACAEVARLHIPRAAGAGASERGGRNLYWRVFWMPEYLRLRAEEQTVPA